MSILICPNCGQPLTLSENGKTFCCLGGHSFDRAKEGYVNLLVGSKSGDTRGDSRESARARHAFLDLDYYKVLKDKMMHFIEENKPENILDICCGEGYYDVLPEESESSFFGFDISKEMVRLASKRFAHEQPARHQYFVGNLAHIPAASGSVDMAMHLFAPFHEEEFTRILSENGILYSVSPGENHLWEMKEVLYDEPYKNDEKAPETKTLTLASRTKVTDHVKIGREDLKTLFGMTPYFYHTSDENKTRLEEVGETPETGIDLTVEFVILEYRKGIQL